MRPIQAKRASRGSYSRCTCTSWPIQCRSSRAGSVCDNLVKRLAYEHQGAQRHGAMLLDLAKALRFSTDQLLGLKTPKEKKSPKTARLLKRLQKVEQLPPTDQCVVPKLVDGLLERHSRSNGRS